MQERCWGEARKVKVYSKGFLKNWVEINADGCGSFLILRSASDGKIRMAWIGAASLPAST